MKICVLFIALMLKVQAEGIDYLCTLSTENVRNSIDNIIKENSSQKLLETYYSVYKNNLINIQYECPEDAVEPGVLLETEKIINSLMEYKRKRIHQ